MEEDGLSPIARIAATEPTHPDSSGLLGTWKHLSASRDELLGARKNASGGELAAINGRLTKTRSEVVDVEDQLRLLGVPRSVCDPTGYQPRGFC
jgi:hypothetical protein